MTTQQQQNPKSNGGQPQNARGCWRPRYSRRETCRHWRPRSPCSNSPSTSPAERTARQRAPCSRRRSGRSYGRRCAESARPRSRSPTTSSPCEHGASGWVGLRDTEGVPAQTAVLEGFLLVAFTFYYTAVSTRAFSGAWIPTLWQVTGPIGPKRLPCHRPSCTLVSAFAALDTFQDTLDSLLQPLNPHQVHGRINVFPYLG